MVKKKSTSITTGGGYIVSIDRASDTRSDGEHPNSEPSVPLVRHPEFYFDNTLIAIQIENTLFNVHKYQLVRSKVFSDMFDNAPDTEGDEPEEIGSPECPVVLKGVAASDFAALLKILYSSHWSSHQPVSEVPLIIPAFRVANILQFSELRAYLLPLAEKGLDDVDKIVLSREFDIKEWITPAHVRLVKREKPLCTQEARKLQVDSVLLISRLREKYRCQSSELSIGDNYCDNCFGFSDRRVSNPGGFGGFGVSYNCKHCGTNQGYYRCIGPSPARSKHSIDDSQVEAEVTKWVENGFVMEEE